VVSLIIFGIMDSKDLIRPPLEHFAERIEGFMLVVLGFSIDGIALAADEAVNPTLMYTCAIVGFLIVFFIKLLHFDCEVFDKENHAMSRHQPTLTWGLVWMIMTGVSASGISLVGAGSEAVIGEIQSGDEEIGTFYTKVYVYGLSLCLLTESGLRFCHTPVYEDFHCSKFLYWFQLVVQVTAAVFIFFVDKFASTNYTVMYYMSFVYGAVVFFNFVDEGIEKYYQRNRADVYKAYLEVLENQALDDDANKTA